MTCLVFCFFFHLFALFVCAWNNKSYHCRPSLVLSFSVSLVITISMENKRYLFAGFSSSSFLVRNEMSGSSMHQSDFENTASQTKRFENPRLVCETVTSRQTSDPISLSSSTSSTRMQSEIYSLSLAKHQSVIRCSIQFNIWISTVGFSFSSSSSHVLFVLHF